MMGSLLSGAKNGARALLARILDEAALVAEVRALSPRALAKLIDHVGLEDAGEIVQLASAEQIGRVFDEDLWRSQAPGEDDTFDAGRFVMWLEILLEAGESAAARRIAELPEDVVTLAFHRLVVVVDTDELAADVSEASVEDGEAIERALEGALTHEIGSWIVIGRRHDGWDAIITALAALDEEDHGACARLLDRCAALSSRETEERGGLYDLLSAEEMLEADVAGDRADRLAGEGFVAPSDAKSFLRLARATPLDQIAKEPRDPVTRAWFREVDRTPAPPTKSAPRLLALLESAGVLRDDARPRRRALRGKGASSGDALGSALGRLLEEAPRIHAERMEELAFLVNVVVAGAAFRDRPFRPGEAAEAVVAVASAGLAHLTKTSSRSVHDIVEKDGVVVAFRAGVHLGALDAFGRGVRGPT